MVEPIKVKIEVIVGNETFSYNYEDNDTDFNYYEWAINALERATSKIKCAIEFYKHEECSEAKAGKND